MKRFNQRDHVSTAPVGTIIPKYDGHETRKTGPGDLLMHQPANFRRVRRVTLRPFCVVALTITISSLLASVSLAQENPAEMRLAEWDRGVSVQSVNQPDMKIYLWFYEWHMFDAVKPGQHTGGTWKNRITVKEDGTYATIESENPGIRLAMEAVNEGAAMQLSVTNRSNHDWPTLASMIACFNPGPRQSRNSQFANMETWFHSAEGLQRLALRAPREIHYNRDLRAAIDAETGGRDRYAWTGKWPRSNVDAVNGLIIRESNDRRWVTAIPWERFVSAE